MMSERYCPQAAHRLLVNGPLQSGKRDVDTSARLRVAPIVARILNRWITSARSCMLKLMSASSTFYHTAIQRRTCFAVDARLTATRAGLIVSFT